jgi:hypothetical protein
MTYRGSEAAPASRVAEERRGRVVGRFCLSCGSVYPLFITRHRGKPSFGKDHVASPCSHEGELFATEVGWWEPAVEVLPRPPEEPPAD